MVNWILSQKTGLPNVNLLFVSAVMVPLQGFFNALIYSIDVAVPVVNFRMQDDWSPRVVDWQSGETDWAGWWVRSWEWLQVSFGWAFSLLFVSAIGGIIRRD